MMQYNIPIQIQIWKLQFQKRTKSFDLKWNLKKLIPVWQENNSRMNGNFEIKKRQNWWDRIKRIRKRKEYWQETSQKFKRKIFEFDKMFLHSLNTISSDFLSTETMKHKSPITMFWIMAKFVAQKMDNFCKKLKQKLLNNIPPIR